MTKGIPNTIIIHQPLHNSIKLQKASTCRHSSTSQPI